MDEKMIEAMTPEERLMALSALMRMHVGAIPLGVGGYDWCVPLVSDKEIQPGDVQSILGTPYMNFKPERLIIHEVSGERCTVDETIAYATVRKGHWWWKKDERVVASRTFVEHKEVVVVPRCNWNVLGVFVGNQMQFPSTPNISGDAFAPDGTLAFRDPCPCGLQITFSIKNVGKVPAQFWGIVVGNEMKTKMRAA